MIKTDSTDMPDFVREVQCCVFYGLLSTLINVELKCGLLFICQEFRMLSHGSQLNLLKFPMIEHRSFLLNDSRVV